MMILSLILAIAAVLPPDDAAPTIGDLERSAFFGAKVVADGRGVVVELVVPGSTAEVAGIRPGDVIVTLDGSKVESPSALVGAIGRLKAGSTATIESRRGDATRKQELTLKGRPIESSDAFAVEYGSVATKAGRLRTIATHPKGEGRHPALFLIQGIGTFSVDNPAGTLADYRTITDDFARRGFVTLRVDKPGCGDSEGGPARDVDFDTELDGYREGLKMLKARGDVDPSNVFLFGHSMGGVMAPLLAVDVPVRGIIAYGTITRTWTEYMLENVRRQMELRGVSYAEIDRRMTVDAALMAHLYADKMDPKEIAAKYPELRARIEETVTEDRYLFDRSLTFFRQLADKNLGGAWESFGGHALAIWGRADVASNEDDHALIARIVNKNHPGRGTFLRLEGIDHGFRRAASRLESLKRLGPPGEFNPAALEASRAWVDEILARPEGRS